MNGQAAETAGDHLYLYGFVRDPDADLSSALTGLAGATEGTPYPLDVCGKRVIVGAHDGSEILQTRRRMLAHTRVLEAAMAVSPVMPMRFGLIAENGAALERLVAANGDEIDLQFEKIGARVEVGLRISFARDAALAAVVADDARIAEERRRLAGRGADAHFDRIELGRRVAETLDRRRTTAQHHVLEAISARCGRVILKPAEEDVEILRAECLLAADAMPELAATAEEAARSCAFAPGSEPQIRLVGPAPPFHFVDLRLTTFGEGTAWA
ncbi:MAG: GvpL/GvpF family gas vesicle protein [Pseudomonadota bacterium]